MILTHEAYQLLLSNSCWFFFPLAVSAYFYPSFDTAKCLHTIFPTSPLKTLFIFNPQPTLSYFTTVIFLSFIKNLTKATPYANGAPSHGARETIGCHDNRNMAAPCDTRSHGTMADQDNTHNVFYVFILIETMIIRCLVGR